MKSSLVHFTLRWLIPLLAFCVLGPAAAYLTSRLRGVDGGPDASFLLSHAGFLGRLGVVAGVFGLALIAGVLGAVGMGRRWGLFCTGLVLAWATWPMGRVDALIGIVQSKSVMPTLAMEAGLLSVLGLGTAFVVMRAPRLMQPQTAALDAGGQPLPQRASEPFGDVWSPQTLLAVGAAMLIAVIPVLIIAQDTLKGQTLAATILAGLFATTAGRLAAPKVSGIVFLAVVAILSIAGPVLAAILGPASEDFVRQTLAGKLMFLARPMPLDYLAGAFCGVPLGLAWSASMLEKHHHAEPATA